MPKTSGLRLIGQRTSDDFSNTFDYRIENIIEQIRIMISGPIITFALSSDGHFTDVKLLANETAVAAGHRLE